MSKKYLLETGTEELPDKFISSAPEQLKNSFSKAFEEAGIEFGNIKTYATPRRLCIIIEGLSESQPDISTEIKGPPAKIAFDSEGNLTPAGFGFAKKQGINPEMLTKKEIAGMEYVYAEIKREGKPVEEILKSIVPDIVLKLQGTRFMRWGDLEIKFSRPIRNIVSLLDDEEVKIKIGNVESSRYSQGHRFSENKRVNIENADTYEENLYNAQVTVDPKKRKNKIEEMLKTAAGSKGGFVQIDKALLDEVTNLVEQATPVIGSFDEKYLEITEDVIVCVLAHHQRYFPVFDKDGKIMNYFITIANHDESNIDNIRKGNEKVVKPRLEDAIFFYKEDTEKPLAEKLESLKGVTFQKGLGSVYDKVIRIRGIAVFMAQGLKLEFGVSQKIVRTAQLCKADLVTCLVREFTELQGIIGGDYARVSGEDELVSLGIREHYLPVSSDGKLAESITGQIVGIADKIDTICGVFALGKAPTGSADPLGLRRAALGIIKTLIGKNINVNLSELTEKAFYTQPVQPEDKEKTIKAVKEFIVQRLKIMLTETYRHDVVDAVISTEDPLSRLSTLMPKLKTVAELVDKDSSKSFLESANRVCRILKSQNFDETVKPELFKEDAEKELWECISSINSDIDNYELVEKLGNCISKIEKFFDKVMVMDNDEKVKQNRLNMLGHLKNKFAKLADFTCIVF